MSNQGKGGAKYSCQTGVEEISESELFDDASKVVIRVKTKGGTLLWNKAKKGDLFPILALCDRRNELHKRSLHATWEAVVRTPPAITARGPIPKIT